MSNTTHFIGIGGTGLSAIARVLLERGESISGSDNQLSLEALALQKDGARINEGHQAEHVNGASLIIRSSAIPDDNVEVIKALENGIPVLKRSEALKQILRKQTVLAIAGSHGKTTTSAMLAWMLSQLGQKPGYIVGSTMKNLSSNAAAGSGDLFVIEADEYDYMFLGLTPKIALISNVEHDHPDIFPTEQSFIEAFKSFTDKIKDGGYLIYCSDNPGASLIGQYARSNSQTVYSYGIEDRAANYRGEDLKSRAGNGYVFDFVAPESQAIHVELGIPGKHNVENAVAALSMIHLLGLPIAEAASELIEFSGTGRRFDIAGEFNGAVLIDDYAHHPTEIKASLSAARDFFPDRRIIAVWQPHTYSRTSLLWDDFSQAFDDAHQVVVTSVFAAREKKPQDFDLNSNIQRLNDSKFKYVPSLSDVEKHLLNHIKEGDLVIVLSAGDALSINQALLAALGNQL